MSRDLVCSAVLLAIAAGYYSAASGIGRSALADEVGPAGLPIVYSSLLAILAVLIGLQAVIRSLAGRQVPKATAPPTAFNPGRAAAIAAVGIAYVFAVRLLGYAVTLALTIAVTALILGVRPSLRLAVIAIAGAGVFWLLFVTILGVPMPGFWGA
ncbi:MAG: tripartite tricarboxylate transporter TctB family protein [Gammaproteobacteria bacterium]